MNLKRECIQVQVGRAGINVGNEFWSQILEEHGVTPDGYFQGSEEQFFGLSAFFKETSKGRFIPRTVLCDTKCDVVPPCIYFYAK